MRVGRISPPPAATAAGLPLRVLRHGEGEAGANMAADARLLAACAVAPGAFPPTLRLYRWRGPAVTLGRFQDAGCLDAGELARRGVGWARRPTGGRAVWHGDSVTFALVAPADAVGGSPRETNALAQRVLAETLASLGLAVTLTRRPRAVGHVGHPLCLAAPWLGEAVTVAGFRVAGVAQARQGGAVLIQGSVAIGLPVYSIMGLFAFPSAAERAAAARRLADEARGLRDLAGRPVAADEVEEALAAAWRRLLTLSRSPA